MSLPDDLPVFTVEDEAAAVTTMRLWAWLVNKGDGVTWTPEHLLRFSFAVCQVYAGRITKRDDGWFVFLYSGDPAVFPTFREAYDYAIRAAGSLDVL